MSRIAVTIRVITFGSFLCPFSTYRMSAIPHQPERHHTELQLRGRYVPIGTRLRDMHKKVREHLPGRIPAGDRLDVRHQLVGRSVPTNPKPELTVRNAQL